LRANKWQAVRYGLNGSFIDSSAHLKKNSMTCKEAIMMLLGKVKPYAEDLGGAHYLDMLDRILQHGSSAQRQRDIYTKSGSFKKVIKKMNEEFWS
jgi:carboxylate-amine ligase